VGKKRKKEKKGGGWVLFGWVLQVYVGVRFFFLVPLGWVQGALEPPPPPPKKTPTEVGGCLFRDFGVFFNKHVFGVFELPMQRDVQKCNKKVYEKKTTWNFLIFL
jgi:hypothetical protein